MQSQVCSYLKRLAMQQEVTSNVETENANVIHFELGEVSVTKKKIVKGKTYIVRSTFAGKKDFAKTIQQLAIKQAYKK